jgi:hypothetical protein
MKPLHAANIKERDSLIYNMGKNVLRVIKVGQILGEHKGKVNLFLFGER